MRITTSGTSTGVSAHLSLLLARRYDNEGLCVQGVGAELLVQRFWPAAICRVFALRQAGLLATRTLATTYTATAQRAAGHPADTARGAP